jgi:hypothetical protein
MPQMPLWFQCSYEFAEEISLDTPLVFHCLLRTGKLRGLVGHTFLRSTSHYSHRPHPIGNEHPRQVRLTN